MSEATATKSNLKSEARKRTGEVQSFQHDFLLKRENNHLKVAGHLMRLFSPVRRSTEEVASGIAGLLPFEETVPTDVRCAKQLTISANLVHYQKQDPDNCMPRISASHGAVAGGGAGAASPDPGTICIGFCA